MSNKKERAAMTTATEKPTLVPKLRFPEFRGMTAWTTPTLAEISVPVVDRVGDRKLIPVSISAGVGFVPQAEKFGRDISGNQYRQYTIVRDGDFVYNKGNSLKFPQGCVYDLQEWGEVAVPNVFICFRLKENYKNRFLRQCFEKNIHGIQLKAHITSGVRSNGLLNISKETFFGVRVPIPSTKEQQKIADCLSSIDELIALETQKLEQLKAYKKGLMQQLFPREGETAPCLRFPEFEKSWSFVNITDFFDLTDKAEKTTAFDKEKVLTVKLHAAGVVKSERTTLTGGANYFNRKNGQFIFSKIDLLNGAFGLVPESLDGFASSSDVPAYSFKAECSSSFFINWLKAKYKFLEIERTGTSSTLKRVSPEKFLSLAILVPTFVEQQKIADCLTSLDDRITSQTQKIESLKTHKKGLMQQLFPTMGEV